ncbi:MAG: amidohydrolase family protein [Bacteroidia bacterium]|nr:amidohydrolase family protein [Bacteroidia bacterium]
MLRFVTLSLLACALPLLAAAQITPIPAPAQSAPIVIRKATVHVGNGQVLENTDLLITGGKLTAIGVDVNAPKTADLITIDAAGRHVYPGLIALGTALGLVEIEAVRATNDVRETGDFNPAARAQAGYNTDSHILPVVRSNGVLLAQVAPAGGVISGRSSAVQLDAWNWEDATVRADEGLYLNWPSGQVPGFALGNPEAEKRFRDRAQEQLTALYNYFESAQAYTAATPTRNDLQLAALAPFLKGEGRVYIQASSVTDIEQAVAFADRFKLKVAIVGGTEAETLAPLLKSRGIPVVVLGTHQLPGRPDDPVDAAYSLPARLKAAGLTVAIAVGREGYQNFNLPFHAGTAAAYGLTPEEALSAITQVPAMLMGIEGRVGTLEVGKDATLVVSEGDILDMRTSRVTHAFIEGRQIDLNNKHKDLNRKWQEKYRRQR